MKLGGTSLALRRRIATGQPYFTGHGIDVGGGHDGLDRYASLLGFESCKNWDMPDGDAQFLTSVPDGTYDFLHSSHCLEHMVDPAVALANWIRVVRGGGFLVITVPDEELYEHLHWPSRFNQDHKWSFTIYRGAPLLPKSINIFDLLMTVWQSVEIIKVERIEAGFRFDLGDADQTASATAECAIEIVLRKKGEAPVRANPSQVFPPFVELAECRFGHILFPPKDQYVGRSFKEYGQFSQGELDLFSHFIGTGAVVLDIGANIGAHTVPLAQLVGDGGVVVAFEPQPVLHQILSANLVLNSIPNVLTYAMALGNAEGECLFPVLDYSQPNNFGGIGVDMVEEGEAVPMGRLDDFQLERVDFIKLDVEGFESQVLEGAAETIARCHPIMYIENDRKEKSAELIQRLFDMGYRLWWHTPPLFSPDNFNGNSVNVFPGIVSINMLAIHREMRPIEGLREVLTPHDNWM
ncbi:MAG: FkbM family methyltransferase [Holophagaceae bacterium]|uniref:FkbM family methyltransferase n=1 Tax=Candidatus Geothrix skivensis TaxID=2954439 RepID=A0A9D7SGP2_9BACT|nr:FkbM family methyltransferase [Candidatus Geothrix skivensis]